MLDLQFDDLAIIGKVTITPDGDLHTPTQLSVGDGGQVIARADGSLEVATGAAGFKADGTLRLVSPSETVGGITTHRFIIEDSAGNQYELFVRKITV